MDVCIVWSGYLTRAELGRVFQGALEPWVRDWIPVWPAFWVGVPVRHAERHSRSAFLALWQG